MSEQRSINQEYQEGQERQKDVPISRKDFEDSKGSGNFIKLEANKDYVLGFVAAKYVKRDFGEGLKPTLVLEIDNLDGIALDEPVEFSTSSKLLANQIEEYRENTDCNLLTWFFKIRKTGEGVQTKYVLTPQKPRPKE
jgi:hypothetical protein